MKSSFQDCSANSHAPLLWLCQKHPAPFPSGKSSLIIDEDQVEEENEVGEQNEVEVEEIVTGEVGDVGGMIQLLCEYFMIKIL